MDANSYKKEQKKMIGIIDADLVGRQNHRFPNLVCEKISQYWKDHGAEVELALTYNNLEKYDEVYISKVFTDTPVPSWIKMTTLKKLWGSFYKEDAPKWLKEGTGKPKIHIGGTGFFFDQAPALKQAIEHYIPDYHLYDKWIANDIKQAEEECLKSGKEFNKVKYSGQYKEYLDYSIGFLTRGCFRKCQFCVNQKYDHVESWSNILEFYDPTRKKICFLDDNFLGCPQWRELLLKIIELDKPYKFKQGLDERLLTDEKCKMLFNSKYDGDLTFAFDKISDYDLIKEKLKLIKKYSKTKGVMFYVLVGFESTDVTDIENAFKRIALLMHYRCLPYIMRYMSENNAPWKDSKYRSMYVTMARWCNQPSILKKMSFREFCVANQALHKTKGTLCSAMQAMTNFEKENPKIAKKYFDLHFGE